MKVGRETDRKDAFKVPITVMQLTGLQGQEDKGISKEAIWETE